MGRNREGGTQRQNSRWATSGAFFEGMQGRYGGSEHGFEKFSPRALSLHPLAISTASKLKRFLALEK